MLGGKHDCVLWFSAGAPFREPMRDLRHAVPGERTWRVVPFVAVWQFEGDDEALEARVSSDGAGLLVVRSGTACRAPTVGSGETEKNASATEASTDDRVAFLRWRSLKPTLLNF
jgi:hypothetical protein